MSSSLPSSPHRRRRPGTRPARVLAASALAVTLAVPALPVAAQAHSGKSPGPKIVAKGLNNPRGLEVARDGAIYVAESGAGGRILTTGSSEGQPAQICVGWTGGVTRIRDGVQRRVTTLPSFAEAVTGPSGPRCVGAGSGTAATGPSDVAVGDGKLAVTMGLGGNLTTRAQLPASVRSYFGTLLKVRHNGKATRVADLTAYEARKNPDKGEVDSNPYGLARLRDGSWLATDAGGNDLLRVWPNGKIRTVAVFPNLAPTPFVAPSCYNSLPSQAKAQLPPPGTPIPAQAVPTSVVVGPDGFYYVSLLSGFPFTEGNARIYRVNPRTGAVSTVTAGLTQVVGIAFGRDGSLYAAEISTRSLLEAELCNKPAPGAVVRIKHGTVSTVASNLPTPGGVAVARDGAVYVTVNSILAGQGQVWRLPGR